MTVLEDLVPATLLSCMRDGGVVRLASDDLGEIEWERFSAELGRRIVILDTVDCLSARDIIATISDAFEFPEDSECDWDCVDDFLGDYDVDPSTGLVVLWSGWESLAAEDDHVMATAVDAFHTAAQSWADEDIPWTVVIVGEGAGWGLPWVGSGPPPWDEDDSDALDPGEEEDG